MAKRQPESPSIEKLRGQILEAKTTGLSREKIQKLQQLLDRLIDSQF